MKKLKNIIIILFIIIILLIISIIFVKKSTVKNEKELVTPEKEIEAPFEQKEKIMRLEYSIINKVIDTYIQNLNKNTYIDASGIQVVSDQQIKQNIINLLSKTYVDKNNLTPENLEKYIKLTEEPLLFVPINMKGLTTGNVKTYVAEGFTVNYDYELEDDITFIVNLDYQNRTFSIEPTLNKYNEINSADNIISIEKNSNNKYNSSGINTETITIDYINRLKRMSLAKPELLYEYLDEEYRNKRFKNIENFKDFIEKNYEEIKKLDINGYLVNSYSEYSQYVAKDKYNNIYIFNEKDPLNYKILLDTYTINSEDFKKAYNEGNNADKAKLNIDKWIKMLNNRDYKNAYKYLDETFRSNNFDTEEKFEQYMREEFPLHYKLSVGKFEEINGTYTQKIVLKDITGESEEEIENTIVMKLKDNYEFVMSFEIK